MVAYLVAKHVHIACVAASGAGFIGRGISALWGKPRPVSRWLKLAPHINDTVLLAAGVVMVVAAGQYPFAEPWLTAKFFGLIAYVILGSVALKPGRARGVRIGAWFGALAVFAYLVSVAVTKDPLGFLGLIGVRG